MQVVRWPVKSERISYKADTGVKVYTLTRFCRLYGFHAFPEDKKSWIGSLWGEKALFFIGAAGIAVRMIAPHVKDKFTDSPVLVMDEKGSYVIPLLSGHVGGAVELAKEIAEKINAQAVLTTATDVEQKFAVDVFAKSNGLVLTDRKKQRRSQLWFWMGIRLDFTVYFQ